MEDTKANLHLLIEILEAKGRCLDQVLAITENQESLLLSQESGSEINLLFNGLCQEKQRLIDEVLHSDQLFQNLFVKLGDDLDGLLPEFEVEVKAMQDRVRQVMDLDVKIRVTEQRNKALASKARKIQKLPLSEASKTQLLDQYKKHKNNTQF